MVAFAALIGWALGAWWTHIAVRNHGGTPMPGVWGLMGFEIDADDDTVGSLDQETDRVFGGTSVSRALDARDHRWDAAPVRPAASGTAAGATASRGCPKCGAVTSGADSRFCRSCGAPLEG